MLRLVSVTLFAGAMLAATPVMAQEASGQIGNQFCGKDLQPMIAKREELAKTLQAVNKRPRPKTFEQAKKTFNDFCGTLGTYIANDKKMVDYMSANKEFCAITDQNIEQISQDMKQTLATRAKICSHPPREQAAPAAKGGAPAIPKPPVNLRLQ